MSLTPKIIATKLENILASRNFLMAALAWFLIQTVFIALSTNPGIPPDELYHHQLITIYSHQFSPFLNDQPFIPSLGDIAHTPSFLYHFLLSFPDRLFRSFQLSSLQEIIGLRFINVLLGLGTLVVTAKLVTALKFKPLIRNLVVFVFANILMFGFLSASINYDNLQVLLVSLSLLLLVKLTHRHSLNQLFILLILLIITPLVKVTALITSFAILLALLYVYRARTKILVQSLNQQFRKKNPKLICLVLLLSIATTLFVGKVGTNFLKYHQTTPSCAKLYTLATCDQNALFHRSQLAKNSPERYAPRKSVASYTTSWLKSMRTRIFGIFAHKSVADSWLVKIGSTLFIALGLIAITSKYRFNNPALNLLIFIALFYSVALFVQNYLGYLRTGKTFGLQGRYLFPVLSVYLLMIINYSWRSISKSHLLRMTYLIFLFGLFIVAGLPSYIYLTTPDWHTNFMRAFNS